MGSLNALMALAQQALMADQQALNITANNVANQNTPGYTRQVAQWRENDVVTLGNLILGNGASVGQGVSQRDRVLEQRVQQQTQTQAQSEAFENALNQIQNLFGLSADSQNGSSSTTQLGSSLNSFFNSLTALSSNPSDTSARQAVISAAQNLAGIFNSTANQMAAIHDSLNQQVSGDVDQINGLLSTVASLNQKISKLSSDSDAGALEDQRQQAIAQLSQYVGLDQITNEKNQITLTTSTGAVLVSGDQTFALSAVDVAGATHVVAGSPAKDVTGGLTGGDLGGVLEARDQKMPQYQTALDELAYQLGTQINQLNEQGLDGSGNPGQALFTLPTSADGAARQIAMTTTHPDAVAAAATTEGATGASNAQKMADLATGKTFSGESPSDFLTNLLGQIGTDASAATTDDAAQKATLSQLTSQRNSLSGVSLDEEASNLTNYQRAYEAAAKIFSITDELMASALNLGVTTAVS